MGSGDFDRAWRHVCRWPNSQQVLTVALLTTSAVVASPANAVDGTWSGPGTEWTNPANWSSNPSLPDGTATFTSTGPTTVVNSGTVTIGSIQFTVAPAAPTRIITTNAAFDVTGSGIFNNSVNLQEFNNSSTFTFRNSSTASGGAGSVTFLNSGSLNFRDTSTMGTALIANSGAVQFLNNSTAGSGLLNSSSGTVNFRDSSKAGTASINLGGPVDFNDSSSADHASIQLTFSDPLTFRGNSTADHAAITSLLLSRVIFRDQSTAANATITQINNIPITEFFDNSTAAAAHIVGGTVYFHGSSNAGSATISAGASFYDQSLAGTATIQNTGQQIFFGLSGGSDTSSADHATISNKVSGNGSSKGIMYFYAHTTAGNATITADNGGQVFFHDSSTGGAARFITNTGGVFDISQLATAGASAGSIEGAGNYYLGSKQLTVGGNNLSTVVSGVISDGSCGCAAVSGGTGGSLVKVGTGSLVLSGNNTYTGTTTVDGGLLAVNGSLASSDVIVHAGGTLAGTGSVAAVSVSGGTFAPGSGTPGSTMTVSGSLVLTAASTYLVQIDPATAALANVASTATLGGAIVSAVYANGTYVAKRYTILTAGSVSGTFSGPVNTNLPGGFNASLSYDATHAYLDLALGFANFGGGLNGNQQNVANALVNFFNSTGGIPSVFGTLTPAGLTQVSGESAIGSQQTTFNAMNLFMGTMLDPFIDGRGATSAGTAYAEQNALAYAAGRSTNDAYAALYRKAPLAKVYDPRWSVWVAAYGGSQTTSGNTAIGSNDTTSRLFGSAVGFDYRFSPNTIAGFALAGGATSFSVSALGSGRSDLFQAGAFVRHNVGPAYIAGALAYGWQEVTTDRTVTVAGIDRLRAEFNANAWSGRIEGGYRFVAPWIGGIGLTPYAAGQFITFKLPAYAEQAVAGANTFALTYNSRSVTSTRSELGLRADKSLALANAVLTLRGRAAWAHDFNPDRAIGATFQTLPGASFVVNGARPAADSALTTASAELKWLNGWSVAATFEGEFSNVTESYAGKGVVRYTW